MNQEYLKGIHSEMCGKDAIIFRATENNIISFLKNSLSAERSEIRTLDGKRFLTTIKGKWIDICPDRMYLEEKLKPLLLAVKEGKKNLIPLKQIGAEQLEGYCPPMPDWNYFFWSGYSDEDYDNFRKQEEPKRVFYEAFGEKFPIQLIVKGYSYTGNLEIEMVNWKYRYPSPWATLTVDLHEVCEKDCTYVDTNHHGRKILSWISESGLGEVTGEISRNGYCTYEKVRFYPERLKYYDLEGYRRYEAKYEEIHKTSLKRNN